MKTLKEKFKLQIKCENNCFTTISNIEKIDFKIYRQTKIKNDINDNPWNIYSELDSSIGIIMTIYYIVSAYSLTSEIPAHEILFEKIFNKISDDQTDEYKIIMPINKSITSNFYITSYDLEMSLKNFNKGVVKMESTGIPIFT